MKQQEDLPLLQCSLFSEQQYFKTNEIFRLDINFNLSQLYKQFSIIRESCESQK